MKKKMPDIKEMLARRLPRVGVWRLSIDWRCCRHCWLRSQPCRPIFEGRL